MSNVVVVSPETESANEVREEAAATEAVADAAVEVAQIEADRDVKLAEIAADSAETQTEALAEAVADETKEKIETCLNMLVTLTERVSFIEAETASIRQTLTQPEPNQPNLPASESVEVTPVSPEETGAVAVEVVEAEPPAEAKPKGKRPRWI